MLVTARVRRLVILGCLAALPALARPSESPEASADPLAKAQAEVESASAAAQAAMRVGPAQIALLDQGVLNLPSGYVFVPAQESKRLLTSMGNSATEDVLGMVLSQHASAHWFMVARFEKAGYIKDDDAKEWNADELLRGLKDGTEAANPQRLARGIPAMEVLGWVEAPHYDAGTHRLIWSAATREKSAPASAEKGINYNTYALGRDGYLSLNLVTDLASIEAHKPIAKQMLAALEFQPGKRYADFDASTDRVAAYGLAALVAGAGVKKLGLLALAGAFLAKFAKVIALGGAVALAGVSKLKRKTA